MKAPTVFWTMAGKGSMWRRLACRLVGHVWRPSTTVSSGAETEVVTSEGCLRCHRWVRGNRVRP